MKTLSTLAITAAIAAFAFSAPVLAADMPSGAQPKAGLTDALKNNAGKAVEQAKQKADDTATKIEDKLGVKKDAPKPEIVDVQQETVTVQTPQGVAQETEITVTPEAPAAPAK